MPSRCACGIATWATPARRCLFTSFGHGQWSIGRDLDFDPRIGVVRLPLISNLVGHPRFCNLETWLHGKLEIKIRPKCAVRICTNEADGSRDWCHTHYTRWRLTGDVREEIPIRKYVKRRDDGKPLDQSVPWSCLVPGCPAKYEYGKGVCNRHWQRFRRNGRVGKWRHPGIEHVGRYKLVTAQGHPLANDKGMVYQHRKVLYDEIGPGPHPCHHCQAKGRTTMVRWEEERGEADDVLWVDHLSNQPGDNSLHNLVPSCPKCNNGADRKISDGFVSRNWELVEIIDEPDEPDEPDELEPEPATVIAATVIPTPTITVRQPKVVTMPGLKAA